MSFMDTVSRKVQDFENLQDSFGSRAFIAERCICGNMRHPWVTDFIPVNENGLGILDEKDTKNGRYFSIVCAKCGGRGPACESIPLAILGFNYQNGFNLTKTGREFVERYLLGDLTRSDKLAMMSLENLGDLGDFR